MCTSMLAGRGHRLGQISTWIFESNRWCSLWPLSTALVFEEVTKPDAKRKQTPESSANLEEERQPTMTQKEKSFGSLVLSCAHLI